MLQQLARAGVRLALVHYELGIGVADHDTALSTKMSQHIAPLMAPGGLIISQDPMEGFDPIKGPDSVDAKRYLFYRA